MRDGCGALAVRATDWLEVGETTSIEDGEEIGS